MKSLNENYQLIYCLLNRINLPCLHPTTQLIAEEGVQVFRRYLAQYG